MSTLQQEAEEIANTVFTSTQRIRESYERQIRQLAEELEARDTRIRQLENQCRILAKRVDELEGRDDTGAGI